MDSTDAGNVPFSLRYEGPALTEGLMDVRDLAPALLAFGDLCDRANRELYGDDSRIDVKIRTVAPGSVLVDMLVWATTGGGLALLGYAVTNADKVAKVLDLVKSGFALAKEVKGDISKTWLEDAVTRVVVEHRHTFPDLDDFADHLRRFVQNPVAQDDMSAVARPLRSAGVDRLRLIGSEADIETVEATEVDYIDALPALSSGTYWPEEVPPPDNVSTVTKWYRLLTSSNLPNRKWRITDGLPDEAISVRVANPEILQRASDGTLGIEVGFFVKARIKTVSRFEDNDLKTEHFLEDIVEIRPPMPRRDRGPGLF